MDKMISITIILFIMGIFILIISSFIGRVSNLALVPTPIQYQNLQHQNNRLLYEMCVATECDWKRYECVVACKNNWRMEWASSTEIK